MIAAYPRLFVIALVTAACGRVAADAVIDSSVDNADAVNVPEITLADATTASQVAASPGVQSVAAACPCAEKAACPELIITNIDYLPAVPPGSWDKQANSGVAAALMVIGHLLGQKMTSADIVNSQAYLAQISGGGYQTRGGNGDPSGVTTLQLVDLALKYGLGASPRALPSCEAFAGDLTSNRPLVVLVEAQHGNHWPNDLFAPGPPQFMVLTGMDGEFAYVYDPAQEIQIDAIGPGAPGKDANGRRYRWPGFAAAWARNGDMTVRIAYKM